MSGDASSTSTSFPSNPTKAKAHLDRVRDNQRRSRARRKEYLVELEDKFRQCEQLGVEASSEMQAAARAVLAENSRLRAILRQKGVSDEEMDSYTGIDSASDFDIGASDVLTAGSALPPEGTRLRTSIDTTPVQGLAGLLNTRVPCCPAKADDEDTRGRGSSALADGGPSQTRIRTSRPRSPLQSTLLGGHTTPTATGSAMSTPVSSSEPWQQSHFDAALPHSLGQPLQAGLPFNGGSQRPDAGSLPLPSYDAYQTQLQQFHPQYQQQPLPAQRADSLAYPVHPQNQYQSSYGSNLDQNSSRLDSHHALGQPPQARGYGSADLSMSDTIPPDMQAQFLRGLSDQSYHQGGPQHQQMPNMGFPNAGFGNSFKIEGLDPGYTDNWQNLGQTMNWPNESRDTSGNNWGA